MHHIFQLAKFETDRITTEEHRTWVKKQNFARHLDFKFNGSSKAFKLMTDKVLPPLTELSNEVVQEAAIVPEADGRFTVFCERDHGFRNAFSLQVGTCATQVLTIHDDHLVVSSPNQNIESSAITVRQNQILCSPEDIFSALNDYWIPFWTYNGDPTSNEEFQAFLHSLPNQAISNISIDDVGVWLDAIKSLKPLSARGIDAISSAELKQLPATCIQDLIKIIREFDKGFPNWMMLSICYPLPKKWPRPRASQTRPITVMAQLYRLWSSVVSRQLLRHFSQIFPCEITGMLPGRGAFDASFFQQFLIEKFQAAGQAYCGLCLDLIKCFNTINRPRVASLMVKLGVPQFVVDTWFHSVLHLQRVWMINGQTSLPVPCDNGCPEGDSLSVVCMLSIAFLWIFHIRQKDQSSHVSAYADNWGWLATDVAAHDHVVEATLSMVQHFGMSIDWDKSWIWASNAEHLHFIKNAVQHRVGEGLVRKLSRGVDLGCQRTYTGPPRLGSLRGKFEQAQAHLVKLSSMPHNLKVKTHLVQAGVYPAVFTGCELVPIGENHLDQLRTNVTSALLGHSISRNSAVAVQAIPSLRDPEEELLLRILCATKRFLFRASEEHRKIFFEILVKHTGLYSDCRGPIGTLKFHTQRIGWNFTREGLLQLDPFVALPLMDISKRHLAWWINKAWNEHLLLFHSQRKSWKGLPPIASFATRQIIQSFPVDKQKALIQEIGASFQTNLQQSKWDSNVTGECSFCLQMDTRHHRLFTCDAVADLRTPFAETIEFFEERGSLVHELPVVHASLDWDYHRVLHHHQPDIPFDENFTNRIRVLESQGHKCTFFTDGSCMNPHSRDTRYSAFAIVLDLTISKIERDDAVKQFLLHKSDPSCLACVYQARTPGEQHIHRAELFAVLVLLENFRYFRVFTDSQFVIFVVNACRSVPSPDLLSSIDNFDLVKRVWMALRQGDFEILKVKAHVSPADQDWDTAFITLGNQKANDCAIHACKNLQKSFVSSLQEAQNDLAKFQVHLKNLFDLILAIQKRRASLDAENKNNNCNQVQGCRQSIQNVLANWVVENMVSLQAPRMQIHHRVAWGPIIANSLKEWMSLIQWPSSRAIPDDFGVTWVELSLGYAIHIGMPLPVKRSDNNGVERLTVFSTSAEVEAFGLKLSEHANAFSILWKQMGDLQDTGFGPPIDRGLVRSLYVQGASFQSYGFHWRPSFPFQKEVVQLMQSYLKGLNGTALVSFPVYKWSPKLDVVALQKDYEISWGRKLTGTNSAAKEVRAFRRNPQGALRFR